MKFIQLIPRRLLSKRAPSMLAGDMLGNFEVQGLSKVHALLRTFTPKERLPELHTPNLYGGEILTNALLAATKVLTPTVHHQPSSLAIEFVRAGSYGTPIEYSVTKMHESYRFTQSSVFIKQNEKAMAMANVSFHYDEQSPEPDYDPPFPGNVPSPDQLPLLQTWADEQHE